jgi:predicted esterase
MAPGKLRAGHCQGKPRAYVPAMARDVHRDQPVLVGGAPPAEAAGALVLLHGRGGSAQEMLALARELDRPRIACYVPEAAGRTWYPYSMLEQLEKNQSHLNSALRLLQSVMGRMEGAGMASERVALFGFSQGACLALEFAVRNPRRYGAVVGLSGGLLGPEGTPRVYAGSFDGTPVFLGSGDVDPNVPKRRVDQTAAVLERLGARVTKRIFPGLAHAMNAEELEIVRGMLDRLGSGGSSA